MNQITHWLDNSNVYGSDKETLQALRQYQDGLLDYKMTDDGEELLPDDPHEACRDGTTCLFSGRKFKLTVILFEPLTFIFTLRSILTNYLKPILSFMGFNFHR